MSKLLDTAAVATWASKRQGFWLRLWSLAAVVALSIGCTTPSGSATQQAGPTPVVLPTNTAQKTPVIVGPLPTTQTSGPYWRGSPNARVVIEEWVDMQ